MQTVASRALRCLPWFAMSPCFALLSLLVTTLTAASQAIPAADLRALTTPQSQTLLLFFVASDCPVSNRYFPEMERLALASAPHKVQTRYIYPNTYENLPEAQHHQAEFGASPDDARTDANGELVHLTGARTTPEAVVLLKQGSGWKVAYRGRIDDRYIHIGLERVQVEHHDLQAALTAVLAGKPAPPPTGPAVGCAIMAAR